MKHSVMVIDDHLLVLDGMVSTLSACPELIVTGSFTSFRDLEKAGGPGDTQLLVSDIRVGGQPCLDQLDELRRTCPGLKIVGITGVDDRSVLQKLLAFGFEGLVFKSDPIRELVHAVLAVARGGEYLSPDASMLLSEIRRSTEASAATVARLTTRERQILQLVCAGLSARKIAEQLHISVWTVTNHKANIMGKLGIRNQVGLTRFAMGAGLLNQNGNNHHT